MKRNMGSTGSNCAKVEQVQFDVYVSPGQFPIEEEIRKLNKFASLNDSNVIVNMFLTSNAKELSTVYNDFQTQSSILERKSFLKVTLDSESQKVNEMRRAHGLICNNKSEKSVYQNADSQIVAILEKVQDICFQPSNIANSPSSSIGMVRAPIPNDSPLLKQIPQLFNEENFYPIAIDRVFVSEFSSVSRIKAYLASGQSEIACALARIMVEFSHFDSGKKTALFNAFRRNVFTPEIQQLFGSITQSAIVNFKTFFSSAQNGEFIAACNTFFGKHTEDKRVLRCFDILANAKPLNSASYNESIPQADSEAELFREEVRSFNFLQSFGKQLFASMSYLRLESATTANQVIDKLQRFSEGDKEIYSGLSSYIYYRVPLANPIVEPALHISRYLADVLFLKLNVQHIHANSEPQVSSKSNKEIRQPVSPERKQEEIDELKGFLTTPVRSSQISSEQKHPHGVFAPSHRSGFKSPPRLNRHSNALFHR